MATDIEESDTDDHERPAPPKRQCTRLLNNDAVWDTDKSLEKKEEAPQITESVEYDDAEKQAREELKRWQACQVANGYVDNIINIVLENCMDSLEDNDMEDIAVMMAIFNHGLSAGIVSEAAACYSVKAPGYGTNNNNNNTNNNNKSVVRCSCPSNGVQGNFENVATTSSGSLRLNGTREEERLDWDLDKIDENDQQENILERAVAEAIKKKGLSALSVDYG